MRRIKGLHDIKTHGTLALAGVLISVARDWRRTSHSYGCNVIKDFSDYDVARPIDKKPSVRGEERLPIYFKEKMAHYLLGIIEKTISELESFAKEGIEGTEKELAYLRQKRDRIQKDMQDNQ